MKMLNIEDLIVKFLLNTMNSYTAKKKSINSYLEGTTFFPKYIKPVYIFYLKCRERLSFKINRFVYIRCKNTRKFIKNTKLNVRNYIRTKRNNTWNKIRFTILVIWEIIFFIKNTWVALKNKVREFFIFLARIVRRIYLYFTNYDKEKSVWERFVLKRHKKIRVSFIFIREVLGRFIFDLRKANYYYYLEQNLITKILAFYFLVTFWLSTYLLLTWFNCQIPFKVIYTNTLTFLSYERLGIMWDHEFVSPYLVKVKNRYYLSRGTVFSVHNKSRFFKRWHFSPKRFSVMRSLMLYLLNTDNRYKYKIKQRFFINSIIQDKIFARDNPRLQYKIGRIDWEHLLDYYICNVIYDEFIDRFFWKWTWHDDFWLEGQAVYLDFAWKNLLYTQEQFWFFITSNTNYFFILRLKKLIQNYLFPPFLFYYMLLFWWTNTYLLIEWGFVYYHGLVAKMFIKSKKRKIKEDIWVDGNWLWKSAFLKTYKTLFLKNFLPFTLENDYLTVCKFKSVLNNHLVGRFLKNTLILKNNWFAYKKLIFVLDFKKVNDLKIKQKHQVPSVKKYDKLTDNEYISKYKTK